MSESKAVYVTRRKIRNDQNIVYQLYKTNRDFSGVLNNDKSNFSCQFDSYKDNVKCTCKHVIRVKRHQDTKYYSGLPKQIYAYHGSRSITDVGVSGVKVIERKKVKRVYLPETDDRGVGSSLITSGICKKTQYKSSLSEYKGTSSKCVGGILEYNIACVINEKLSSIITTKSETTSPIINTYLKNTAIGSNTVEKIFETIGTQFETEKEDEKRTMHVKTEEKFEVAPKVENEVTEKVGTSNKSEMVGTIDKFDMIEDKRKREMEKKAKEIERAFSSDSLVQHVHNLENPSDEKQSRSSFQDPMENKLEREYRKMFSIKSKESKPVYERPIPEYKSASVLRRRFEALRRGLVKKDDSNSQRRNVLVIKDSAQESIPNHKDVSVTSDPPSLIARSFSNTPKHSPVVASAEHQRSSIPNKTERCSVQWPQNMTDSESQGVKGMFKLWGKKFNFEEDGYNKQSSSCCEKSEKSDKSKLTTPPSKKEGKKFFFFKKKSKEKPPQYKPKKDVTAGRCEIKDGLTLKIGGTVTPKKEEKPNEEECDITRKTWLRKFLSHTIESARSVNVRWNNSMYATSSSTVFELMDNVYKNTGVIFRSKSDTTTEASSLYKSYTKHKVNFLQDIEAWMIPKTIPDRTKEIPFRINSNKEVRNKNIEVTISDQKWYIDKSDAYAHKIEVVLHSKNANKAKSKVSSEYLRIDIPKDFFDTSSTDASKRNQSSDEEVYKIVEYETNSEIKRGRKPKREREVGGRPSNDIKVIVSVQDSKNKESKILETVIKRSPTHRDVLIQGSNVNIPMRCDVIGVGIITQRDIRELKKPILKIENNLSDDDETIAQINQKKCEFAESYLHDYYRNWTPSGVDFPGLLYSWCVSDSHLRSCSEKSLPSLNNQGDGSKSCSNMYDDFLTVQMSCENSSCSHCFDKENNANPCFSSKLLKKLMGPKPKPTPKPKPIPRRECEAMRVLPKDSLEVLKKRQLYAHSNKSQWQFACDKPVSSPSTESRGPQMAGTPRHDMAIVRPTKKPNCCKKHVSIPHYDDMRELVAQKLSDKPPDGILTFKGVSSCDECATRGTDCAKHAVIIPEPVSIMPSPPCQESCEKTKNPPCNVPNAPTCHIGAHSSSSGSVPSCLSPTPCGVCPAPPPPCPSSLPCNKKRKKKMKKNKSLCTPPGCPITPCTPPPCISPVCPPPPPPCPPPPCQPPPCPPPPCQPPPCQPPPCPPPPCQPPPCPPSPCPPSPCPPSPCKVPSCPASPCKVPSCPASPRKVPSGKPSPCPPSLCPPAPCKLPPCKAPSCQPRPCPPPPCPPSPCPPSPCPPSPCNLPPCQRPPCPPSTPPAGSPSPSTPPPGSPLSAAPPDKKPSPPLISPPAEKTSPSEPVWSPPCNYKPCQIPPCQPSPCFIPPPCASPPSPTCGSPPCKKKFLSLKPSPCMNPPCMKPSRCGKPPCKSPACKEPCMVPPPCGLPVLSDTDPKPPRSDSPPVCERPRPPCMQLPPPCMKPLPSCIRGPPPCKTPPPFLKPRPPTPPKRNSSPKTNTPPLKTNTAPPPKTSPAPPPKTNPAPPAPPKANPPAAPPAPPKTNPPAAPPAPPKANPPAAPPAPPKANPPAAPPTPPKANPPAAPPAPPKANPPAAPPAPPKENQPAAPPTPPKANPPAAPPKTNPSVAPPKTNPPSPPKTNTPPQTNTPPKTKTPPKTPPPSAKTAPVQPSPSAPQSNTCLGNKLPMNQTPCSRPFRAPPCKKEPMKCPGYKGVSPKGSQNARHVKDKGKSSSSSSSDGDSPCSTPPYPRSNTSSGMNLTMAPKQKQGSGNKDQEYPWPMKNQVSNQPSPKCSPPSSPKKKKCLNPKCASVPDTTKISRPEPTPPCRNKPKMSGLYLKMAPSKKKTLAIECNACKTGKKDVIKLDSGERITIKLKSPTTSTEEIREPMNIKVQDEDGQTLFERRDYACGKNKPILYNQMYKDSYNRPVVVTNVTETQVEKELVEEKSDQSLTNLIEIQFKLRIAQGNKTEVNIGNDNNKIEPTKTEMDQKPPEVYIVKNDGTVDDAYETNAKNDMSIKIIVRNYKPKPQIAENRNSEEFSKKISNKFHTVSTGYSDVITTHDDDQVFSIHRATINLSSSVEKTSKTSTDFLSKDFTDNEHINRVSSHSIDQLPTEDENIDEKTISSKKDSQSEKFEETITEGTKSELPDFNDTDEQDAALLGATSNECNVVDQSTPKEEKKALLKKVFKRAHRTQGKDKATVRQLRNMLKIILTDSSDNDENANSGSNELVKDVTYASLKPNYFRDTDSMNNYYQLDSKFSSKDGNLEETATIEDNSVGSESESDTNDVTFQGCMCSKVAEKLNECKLNVSCCCREKSKRDEETYCDIRNDEDMYLFNYNTEYIDVETQNSKHVSSKANSFNVFLHSKDVSVTQTIEDFTSERRQEVKALKMKSKVTKVFPLHKTHIKESEVKKLNQNTILGISDDDKVLVLSDRSQMQSMDTKRNRNEYQTHKHTTIIEADILQSYETKKAVLEIYAEKTKHGEHLVAKLPKFVYERESEIANNHEQIATNSYKAVCKQNIVMMSLRG